VHVCNFITTQIRDKHYKNYCNYCSENNKQSFKIVPRGETSAEGTCGSIRTSRHSALHEVAPQSMQVDVRSVSQCSPVNVHQEEDEVADIH